MQKKDIQNKIRQIIFETTNIKPDQIGDRTSFLNDLDLDSLTMLEIGVNIDEAFNLDLPEEEMEQLTCVETSAELVMRHMSQPVA